MAPPISLQRRLWNHGHPKVRKSAVGIIVGTVLALSAACSGRTCSRAYLALARPLGIGRTRIRHAQLSPAEPGAIRGTRLKAVLLDEQPLPNERRPPVDPTGGKLTPAVALYSTPQVQDFVELCARLRSVSAKEHGDTSALTQLIWDMKAAIDEIPWGYIPAGRFKDEMFSIKELWDSDAVARDPSSLAKMFRDIGPSRLSSKIPEAIDRLLSWNTIFPGSLERRTGVLQDDVSRSLKALAPVIFVEVSRWCGLDFNEAMEIIESDEALREVRQALALSMEDKSDLNAYLSPGRLVPIVMAVIAFAFILSNLVS